MNALELLLTVVFGLAALDVIAWRWGTDTRVGREWQWRSTERTDECTSSSRSVGTHSRGRRA